MAFTKFILHPSSLQTPVEFNFRKGYPCFRICSMLKVYIVIVLKVTKPNWCEKSHKVQEVVSSLLYTVCTFEVSAHVHLCWRAQKYDQISRGWRGQTPGRPWPWRRVRGWWWGRRRRGRRGWWSLCRCLGPGTQGLLMTRGMRGAGATLCTGAGLSQPGRGNCLWRSWTSWQAHLTSRTGVNGLHSSFSSFRPKEEDRVHTRDTHTSQPGPQRGICPTAFVSQQIHNMALLIIRTQLFKA